MKRKIIALGAITLIALTPLVSLSVDEASTNRTAPLPVTSATRSPSAKINATAKANAPEKTAGKKKVTATKSTSSSAASKSKAGPSKSHSSKPSSQQASNKTANPSKEQRQAIQKIADLTTTQKSKLLTLLNEGATEQLALIKGISTTRATAIEKARPVSSIDEVVLVRGIGETTFGEVIAHARSLTARRSSSNSGKSNTSKG